MKAEFETALHILFVLVLPGSHAMFAGYEKSERQTKPIARREPQLFSEQTAQRFHLDHITVDPKVEAVDDSDGNDDDDDNSDAEDDGDTESSASRNGQQSLTESVPYNTSAYCGEDYILGDVNGTNCGADHNIILDQDLCLDAAGRVGATAGTTTDPTAFYIDAALYYKRPQGCFAIPCNDADPTGVCFFFNGVANTPGATAQIYGRPVCSRQKWLNGAAVNGSPHPDSNPSGCAAGYSGILNKTICQQMLACRTLFPGNPFEIDAYNHTLHNQFPQGCFIHDTDGFVYFNEPNSTSFPSQPVGVPVCEVSISSGLHFPEYGSMWS